MTWAYHDEDWDDLELRTEFGRGRPKKACTHRSGDPDCECHKEETEEIDTE